MFRLLKIVALSIGLLLGLTWPAATAVIEVKARGGTNDQRVLAWDEKPQGKLSRRLELLTQPAISGLEAEPMARFLNLPADGPGSLLKNEAGEILVYIRLGDTSTSNLNILTQAGAKIVHVAEAYRTVTAFVGVDQLKMVANIAAIESVLEVLAPFSSADIFQPEDWSQSLPAGPSAQAGCGPATTTEGDTLMKVAAARTTYGLDGSGVTVGVLSFSFNNPSHPLSTTAAIDIARGDLPGPGNPCGRTTPVNVIKEGPSATDEGRAMLQIIHDLAPGAKLAFASASYGIFDYADQIRALRYQARSDIMVDDIIYTYEPFFQDGPISVAIQEVTASGALYFASAGNYHNLFNGQEIGSYEVPAYRPMACPPIPFFTQGDCHDFNPGPGTDNTSSFTMNAGSEVVFDLQWAEPWYGVQTDLDVIVLDNANNVLFPGENNNLITQIPVDSFYWKPNTTVTFKVVIHRHSGVRTPRLKYILIRRPFMTAVEYSPANSFDMFGPTIFGHHGEDTAISVAAVPYNNINSPQNFTSRGFPTYYFSPVIGSTPATPLAIPETRQKPDLAAINGGRNTFFGDFVSGIWRFYGTSASAPHAAGVAALMKQQANQLERFLNQSIAESILENTASNIQFGSPEATGAGLVNALEATNGALFTVPLEKVYVPIVLKK